MFRTFDRDNNGYLTITELAGMLAKLGVEVSKDDVIGVLKELDSNKSGTLEFEEFCQFVINNPYKR